MTNEKEQIELNTTDVEYYTMGHAKTIVNVQSSDDDVSRENIYKAENENEDKTKENSNNEFVTTEF